MRMRLLLDYTDDGLDLDDNNDDADDDIKSNDKQNSVV